MMHASILLVRGTDGARDAESFLGPKVELGSAPLGLNLTQPLRPQKTFAMCGARKKVSQLNLTQHLGYVCISYESMSVQPNLTQIWLLLVYTLGQKTLRPSQALSHRQY